MAATKRSAAVKRVGIRATNKTSSAIKRVGNGTAAAVKRTGTRLSTRAAGAEAKTELQAKRGWEKAKSQFNKADARVEGYIKQNPKKAALIAAGIGAAIAAALAASMRKK